MIEQKDQNKGTYAGVHFDENTHKALACYVYNNGIPNPIPAAKFHTTILYSRKYLPDYTPLGEYVIPYYGIPTEFDIWISNSDDGPATNCLVLKYDCQFLIDRHRYLMEKHGASYDYDDYIPHVTLSYNIGDNFDLSKLSDIKKDIPVLVITQEYGQDLNLNWALEHI